MFTRQRSHFVTALISLAFASTALAQQDIDADSLKTVAEFGGQMHAVADVCGGYTDAQLTSMKAEQQSAMVTGGLPAADFDTAFNKGFQTGQKQLASITAAQKDEMCTQFKAMPK